MKPTLRYIAERANVSIGTVDRVIHDRGRVSEETQNRVRAIIEEIGYSPNIFASNLSTSRVHRFAAILPHTNDNADHWGLHRRGLTAAARELSRMNVEFTEIPFELTSTGSFVRACTEAVAGDFSGYVLVPPAQSEVAEEWALRFSATSPVVLVDSDLPKLDSVYFRGQNPVESGRVCGRLLNYMLPAESKVVLATPQSNAPLLLKRAQGVIEVASEHCRVAQVPVRAEETSSIMTRTLEQILNEHPDTKGIVVPNATVFFMAREFERRASTLGIRLMGYDAIEENVRLLKAGYIDFLIGTHPDTQSYSAMHTLYQLVVLKQAPPRRVTQPVEILIRDNIDSYRSTSSTYVDRTDLA